MASAMHSRRRTRLMKDERGELINIEGMRFAPENELGVVFLFSKVARRLGFRDIEEIKPGFPDCWAYRTTTRGVRRTWIEFEFRSRAFLTHIKKLGRRRLRPRKGVVVCWLNDWPECAEYAEVIELRRVLGLGPQVWTQDTLPEYQNELDSVPRRKGVFWTVAGRARPGDLVLMYRAGTKSEARRYEADETLLGSIANVFQVRSVPTVHKRWGYEGKVTNVALLENPLRLDQMRQDQVLRGAPFVRSNMRGRPNVTPYWYRLYDLILKLNPSRETRQRLLPFAPERL